MYTISILDSVLQHLKARLDQVVIELFPDNPGNYRLNHPNGAVLISYQGSSYSEIEDLTFTTQKRQIELALTIISRSQWHDFGALDLLDRVRQALAGFSARNCQKARIKSESFLSEETGIWSYQMLVICPTLNVEHEFSQPL